MSTPISLSRIVAMLVLASTLALFGGAGAASAQELGVRCMNPETGYIVGVPVGWYYNLRVPADEPVEDIAACRAFSPTDFTLTPGSQPSGIAIFFAQQSGTIDPSDGESVTVDGHEAVRYETSGDPTTYVYEVQLPGDQILVASTSTAWVGTYAENVAYLHEMMTSSLEFVAPSTRLGGADRYATAVEVSAANFAAEQDVVYVATGERYPDALAGSAVAGIASSPILLVTETTIPASTEAELERLAPGRIVVLGGPAAVSNPVAAELATYVDDGDVDRLWGEDRYATAADISAANFGTGVARAYVASGEDFPDALAGGALAGQVDGPLLLVESDAIPQATAQELDRLSPEAIVVLGGPEAISNPVAADLASYTDGEIHRLWGDTRYGTAAEIARWTYEPGIPAVYVTTGVEFPDALAAGPAAVTDDAPIVLVRPGSVPEESADAIERLAPARVIVVGGPEAVSEAVRAVVADLARP